MIQLEVLVKSILNVYCAISPFSVKLHVLKYHLDFIKIAKIYFQLSHRISNIKIILWYSAVDNN